MTPKSTWQFKDEWIRDGYRNKVVDPGNLSVAYSGPAALDLFVQKYDPMASVVDHLWLQLAGDSELKRLEVYAHTTPHTTHHTPHTTHHTPHTTHHTPSQIAYQIGLMFETDFIARDVVQLDTSDAAMDACNYSNSFIQRSTNGTIQLKTKVSVTSHQQFEKFP